MLIESLTLGVGIPLSRALVKLWLPDGHALVQGAAAGIETILRTYIPDFIERRKKARLLEDMAEEVAKRLYPLLEHEFRDVAPNEREAAVLAVGQTIDSLDASSSMLLDVNFDPLSLESILRASDPAAAQRALLSEGGVGIYDFTLRESCHYVVEIATTMPDFLTRVAVDSLKRETEIRNTLEKILDNLPDPAAQLGKESKRFEAEYLRAVARKLDRLQLYGVDLSVANSRYALSVAYISLTASYQSVEGEDSPTGLEESGQSDHAEDEEIFVGVDDVLAETSRLLLRGEAGSGKTTLLQWLAVNAARRSFLAPLDRLNGRIPFFIQLRRFVTGPFPAPETFVGTIAPNLQGVAPPGWVHNQLDTGNALVLVDGVDELPDQRRKEARKWLEELVEQFPLAQFVVTTRPPAVSKEWLNTLDFASSELQPMTLVDIRLFVEHWHAAAFANSDDAAEVDDLKLKDRLLGAIGTNPGLRILAQTPLLCALLCALNRDRKAQLPKNRTELYRVALETLLQRRDVEREVKSLGSDSVGLSQKLILLQDLSLWMLRNGKSDAEKEEAIHRFEQRLRHMPNVALDARSVFDLLLLRSGLLREPIAGRVDFIHRTFQEFLAASETLEQADIGFLVLSAHLDQWREVIILAAGQAGVKQRNDLISGLLSRGDNEPKNRHKLHLLAVACLENSPQLPPELRSAIQARLAELVPPTSMTDARSLASAGDLAVPLLREFNRSGVRTAAASVRTLALVGSELALQTLERYRADGRRTVVRELIKAWPFFDAGEYIDRILRWAHLSRGDLEVSDAAVFGMINRLKDVAPDVRVKFPGGTEALDSIIGLEIPISQVTLKNSRIESLKPLESHPEIQNVRLINSFVREFAPLGLLSGLRTLELSGSLLFSGRQLPIMANLRSLDLSGCRHLEDILGLSRNRNLRTLWLSNARQLQSLAGIEGLPVETLFANNCGALTKLDALSKLDKLRVLMLSACRSIESFGPISEHSDLYYLTLTETKIRTLAELWDLPALYSLDLSFCRDLRHIEGLRQLPSIVRIDLTGCGGIKSFEGLADLANLSHLSLSSTQFSDLNVIAHLRNLKTLSLRASLVEDLRPLANLSSLTTLLLTNSPVKDLSPLEGLTNLRLIDVRGTQVEAGTKKPFVGRGIRFLV